MSQTGGGLVTHRLIGGVEMHDVELRGAAQIDKINVHDVALRGAGLGAQVVDLLGRYVDEEPANEVSALNLKAADVEEEAWK